MSILKRSKSINRFIELLIKQSEYAEEGMQALLQFVRTPEPSLAQRVSDLEGQGDEVRRVLIDELNRTFVTPIDREDIMALSLTVDDILDYAYTTTEEMVLMHVTPDAFIERMVSLLTDAAREIHLGVMRLEDHPNVAGDHAVRAKALENRIESVYREAIAALFQRPPDLEKIVDIFKRREIYRHLSNAADRGDAAANVISDIVVKKI
jgi:hypothetical protein